MTEHELCPGNNLADRLWSETIFDNRFADDQ